MSPFHLQPQINTLNEQEWDRIQQAHILANVQQAFDSVGGDEDPYPSVMSPSVNADAQTLALVLQQQLDAINNEIRLGGGLVVRLGW